jgi:hypothetical protein
VLTAGATLNESLQQLANRDREPVLDKAFRYAKTCKALTAAYRRGDRRLRSTCAARLDMAKFA